MNSVTQTKTWRQYEFGRDYKMRIGLYRTVRENERFYRGDQWRGGTSLPHPVFNLVRRITDYLISTVAVGDVKITYTDENLPFSPRDADAKAIAAGVELLTKHAAYRWEDGKLQKTVFRLLKDAAISGDGIVYCYWDSSLPSCGGWMGDIVTSICDNVNVFPADVTNEDVQSQEYVILAGKSTVEKVRREARANGVPESDVARILPDKGVEARFVPGELAQYEPHTEPEDAPVTYLIKFWKENGKVWFEKSVRECVIKRAETPCRLYPIAKLSWYPTKNCFFGTSPVSCMIPNQKYVNRAYAMVMKHMADSAFSKVIYDRTRIPEWSNEVGEAIAAVGGGNISDAVKIIDTGKLENGYLELLNGVISLTKELAGATETQLGNITPTNTSAILALRETAIQSLENVRTELYVTIENLALIWADMICAYCPNERPLRTHDGYGRADKEILRSAMLHAKIDVADSSRFSSSSTQSLLDRLLDGGYITLCEYLKRLPDGLIPEKAELISARSRDSGGSPSATFNAKPQSDDKRDEAPAEVGDEN